MVEPLYVDDDGREITTHSMLKTFLRCHKQAQYKYAERLKPRMTSVRDKPLRRGVWFHELLEVHYGRTAETWRDRHAVLTDKYAQLFDEEKEALGDLPTECHDMMRSYLWHYGANKEDPHHGWTVMGTEMTYECAWPDDPDRIYRCRIDMLVRDSQQRLWIVDHKTHKSLPDWTFRLMDYASALYIWCLIENGLPVQGFIWNYIRAKAPVVPHLAYVGTPRQALSRSAIETDYPTAYRALKRYQAENGLDIAPYREWLQSLKSARWQEGTVQTSPFFRRDTLVKDDAMLARVVASAMRTRDTMHGYDWSDVDSVERTVDRSCSWICSYGQLCATEMFKGRANDIRHKQFSEGDPLEYYRDEPTYEGN